MRVASVTDVAWHPREPQTVRASHVNAGCSRPCKCEQRWRSAIVCGLKCLACSLARGGRAAAGAEDRRPVVRASPPGRRRRRVRRAGPLRWPAPAFPRTHHAAAAPPARRWPCLQHVEALGLAIDRRHRQHVQRFQELHLSLAAGAADVGEGRAEVGSRPAQFAKIVAVRDAPGSRPPASLRGDASGAGSGTRRAGGAAPSRGRSAK